MQGVKLAPGYYRLVTQPPGPVTTVIYSVTADGVLTTFGLLEWAQTQDGWVASSGSIGLRFFADGTFVAVNGAEEHHGSWAPI